jgi:hypothetical protein
MSIFTGMCDMFFISKQSSITGLSAEERHVSHWKVTGPRTSKRFPVRKPQTNQIAWLQARFCFSPLNSIE